MKEEEKLQKMNDIFKMPRTGMDKFKMRFKKK